MSIFPHLLAQQIFCRPLLIEPSKALQADIDTVGELFVQSVARYRGLSTERVRATEAAVFLGRAGVDAGLADIVASPAEAFAALVKLIAPTHDGPPPQQEMFRQRPGATIVSVAARERAKAWRSR